MTEVFIESARHKVFSDRCAKSKNGHHHVVNLFPEVPHLGCVNCRRRNRKIRLTGENLFNYLKSGGMSLEDAVAQSGFRPRDYDRRIAMGERLKSRAHPTLTKSEAPQ